MTDRFSVFVSEEYRCRVGRRTPANDATLIDELSRRSVISAPYPGGGALRSGTIRGGERGTTHYRRRSCGAGLLLTCAGSAARLSSVTWSRAGPSTGQSSLPTSDRAVARMASERWIGRVSP